MSTPSRPVALARLLVVAIVGGVAAALLLACFVWTYETGIELLWTDLPEALDVEPYQSWYMVAGLVVGGLLVGVGQRILGRNPPPMDEVVDGVRSGRRIAFAVVPKSVVNSVAALCFGGPIGFEAALVSIIAGSSYAVGDHLRSVERFIASAVGVDDVDDLARAWRRVPVWVAAIVGALAYSFMSFGHIDTKEFRFASDQSWIDLGEAFWIAVLAALVAVPVAWTISVVQRAEKSTISARAPELFAVAGGLVIAALAWPEDFVLFSGQQAIQHLDGLSDGTLVYIAVAKWAALCVAFVAGWRGGPIFPTFTSVAALAVIASGVVDIGYDVAIIGATTAVSVVFLKGKVAAAFVLSLYVAPLSYAGVIIVGCVSSAGALALARRARVLPSAPAAAAPAQPTT